MFVQTRGLEIARQGFEILLELNPHVPTYWVNYGFLMKTVGQFGRGLAAYRTAVALDPTNGVAWWGLANLKVARFFPSDIEAMQAALDSPDLPQRTWVDIAFSLATALDQTKDYERAANLLREANRIRDQHPTPESAYVGSGVGEMRRIYSREFFIKHAGSGDPRPDPIFIVGLPRAGSTLIEQILASHSQIEGTEELFALHQIEGELGRATSRQVRRGNRPQPEGRRISPSRRQVPRAGAALATYRSPILHRQEPRELAVCGPDPLPFCPTPRSSTHGEIRWTAALPITCSSIRRAQIFRTTRPSWATLFRLSRHHAPL